MMGQMIAESTITCPHCNASKTETMPTDACQFFYECIGCGLRDAATPESRRLLRVLFVWHGPVPTNSGGGWKGRLLRMTLTSCRVTLARSR
jgi:Zn ribbon nucleic-acid-binding protein